MNSFINKYINVINTSNTINKDDTSLLIYRYNYSVENNGFEPLTPCVQGRCSSQLS